MLLYLQTLKTFFHYLFVSLLGSYSGYMASSLESRQRPPRVLWDIFIAKHPLCINNNDFSSDVFMLVCYFFLSPIYGIVVYSHIEQHLIRSVWVPNLDVRIDRKRL